jgi:hypothetical protein
MGGFCQMAYVTNDIDAAMALWRDRHGVESFLVLRDHEVETGPGRVARKNIALAYADGMQIELLEPLGGADEAYRAPLKQGGGFQMIFHHEGHRAASPEALAAARAAIAAAGFPVVVEGSAPGGIAYFYADCRATIGHIVEHIHYPDSVFAQLDATIPVY